MKFLRKKIQRESKIYLSSNHLRIIILKERKNLVRSNSKLSLRASLSRYFSGVFSGMGPTKMIKPLFVFAK